MQRLSILCVKKSGNKADIFRHLLADLSLRQEQQREDLKAHRTPHLRRNEDVPKSLSFSKMPAKMIEELATSKAIASDHAMESLLEC